MFVDLHMHTFFSDGVLSPAELVCRCRDNGCSAVALTDHADYSNMEFIIESFINAAPRLEKHYGLEVLPGVELTYIPPADMKVMVEAARSLGAEIVVVHGESPVENVPRGTNLAAIKAGCDILAHPGMITPGECALARENGVALELTTRSGHRRTNRHVAETASREGSRLVVNTDSHLPSDLLDRAKFDALLEECGLPDSCFGEFIRNSLDIVERVRIRR